MKNLAKFFVAVAALFVGVSCTTDTTEDLGQQIVGKGQTVLTVSTGESVLDTKTSLGGKVDGTYPIYWSNGDQLSLNGVASAPLANVEANSTSATFTWEGTFDAPFCVAYPASAEGTVTFAAEQEYVPGTFSQNAVPMIGYSDEVGVSGVQLEYLAGVLQFNVSGAATLASMIIETVDGTPIAGVFDCDFATGTVKPQAGSRSSIEYSFGEDGLNISGGKSFHVAVPAGKYDAVKVIMLNAEGGAFEGTIQADGVPEEEGGSGKPALAAGQVRKFTISNWTANRTYFVIKDAQTLEQFAEAVEETPALEAVVLKDVDASSIAATWAPIEGFTGILRGNGKTISGLTQPLFGELKGTVTNLTLNSEVVAGDGVEGELVVVGQDKNGNDVYGSQIFYGLFAKKLVGISTTEGEVTTVAHAQLISCVAKGSLTINNSTATNHTYAASFCFGGLVGLARDAKIIGCTNEAVVTSIKYANASAQAKPYVGGVAGLVYTTEMKNCVNKALVDWNDTTSSKYQTCPHIGGVVGYIEAGSSFSDGKNFGEIRTQKSIRTGGVGGVIGCTEVSVTNAENHGVLNIGSDNGENRYTGGIGGVVARVGAAITLTNCDNHAAINYTADFTVMRLGGVLGSSQNADPNTSATTAATQFAVKMTDCDNYGPITISGKKKTPGAADNVSGPRYGLFYVGGLSSWNTGAITNCKNHKSATITISGGGVLDYGVVASGSNGIETVPQTCIGGAFGRKASSGGTMYNDADIIISGVWTNGNTSSDKTKSTTDVFIGGIYGNSTCSAGKSVNTGNIIINEGTSFNCGLWIGGVAGRMSSSQSGLTNSGNITYSGVKCTNLRLGGIAAVSSSTQTNATNSGDITINGTFGFPTDGKFVFNVGGAVGHLGNTATSVTNSGDINISSPLVVPSTSTWGNFGIGGIAGRGAVKYVDVENTGNITVSSNFAAVPTTTTGEGETAETTNNYTMHPILIGGIYGYGSTGDNDGMDNSGDITVSGTHSYTSGALSVSGIYCRGSNSDTNVMKNCHNTGAISVSTIQESASASTEVAGIVTYQIRGTQQDSTNNGPITFTGKTGHLQIAGISTDDAAGVKFINCDNLEKGVITVNGDTGKDKDHYAYVGGILFANENSITLQDCDNKAAIYVTNTNATKKSFMYVGGVASRLTTSLTFTNCTNSGAINLLSAVKYVGGCVGQVSLDDGSDISSWTGLSNSGDVIYTKEAPGEVTYIGGVVGEVDGATGTIKQWHNSGDVKVAVDATKAINKRVFVGGVAGLTTAVTFSYCSNTGDILAPWSRRTTTGATADIASWVGLLTGARYYHTGADNSAAEPSLRYADNCLLKGTVKRLKTDNKTVDECVVDTVEEVYKYAFAEPGSMEGEQDPTLFMTNISVTTMPVEPTEE